MLRKNEKIRISKYAGTDKFFRGQILMEFAFTMIIILLMFYGVMMIFRWTGLDLVERRISHETKLTMNVNQNFGACMNWTGLVCTGGYFDINSGPQQQLDPYFYEPIPMNAIYQEN